MKERCQQCGDGNREIDALSVGDDETPVMRRTFVCSYCGADGHIDVHRDHGEQARQGPYFGDDQPEQSMTDSNDTQTTETVHSGVSITAKVKRGTETRNQDTLTLKGKGADAEAATEEFEKTLAAAEEHGWPDRLRAIQPEEDDE